MRRASYLIWLLAASLSGCSTELVRQGSDAGVVNPSGEEGSACAPIGQEQCLEGARARACVAAPDGQGRWGPATACPFGGCSFELERCCVDACPLPGELRCGPRGIEECVEIDGCLAWSAPEACPEGTMCDAQGGCIAGCSSTCEPGQRRCVGASSYAECVEVAPACFRYAEEALACPQGAACTEGECSRTCAAGCRIEGETRCVGGGEERCERSAAIGCLAWSTTGRSCGGVVCESPCPSEGEERCFAARAKQRCERTSPGCLEWVGRGACDGPPRASCRSTTIGREVPDGACVQNAPDNRYRTCPAGGSGCLWASCDDGVWTYQCPRKALGSCQNASALFAHQACN